MNSPFPPGTTEYLLISGSSIVFFIFFLQVIMRISAENQLLLSEVRNTIAENNHFLDMQSNYKSLLAFHHAYRNKLQMLNYYAHEESASELVQYISQLSDDFHMSNTSLQTPNVVLNAIVGTKIALAKQRGIDIQLDLQAVPKVVTLDDLQLSIILGAMLDNAIDACVQMPEGRPRWVRVHADMTPERFVFQVQNSCIGEYRYANGVLQTTKSGLGHGVGLARTRDILSNNKGYLTISPEPDNFEVTVYLPYHAEPTNV